MAPSGSSRKQIFVNKRIQGSVLLRFLGYWAVYHFVLWHTLFLFDFLQSRMDLMAGDAAEPLGEVYWNFTLKYFPLLVTAFAILPLLGYDTLKTTHRIVGPLTRFRHALRALRNGQFVREVKTRKGDLLTEFEGEFNEFLKFYNDHDARSKEILRSVGAEEEPLEEQLLRQVQELKSAHREYNAERVPAAEGEA